MRKFWKLTFLVLTLSLWPFQSLSYAKELPELQCGSDCHSNKNRLHKQMTISPECTQCHSSNKSSIITVAANNKEKKNPVLIRSSKKNGNKDMAKISSGEFVMGSNKRWDDEKPEFVAKTAAYLIDLYEVTNSDYKIFVDKTGYTPPPFWDDNKIPEGLEKHPVTYVSWDDASAYCNWTGKRLPTESEWEKAARGKFGNNFPWGNEFDSAKSNSPESGSKGTKPVGSFESGKSPYGIYDMAGNVWEWTSSWYLPHPGNKVVNSKYGKKNRVIKGGSWFDCVAYNCGISAPSYNRGAVVPSTRNNTIGFRCVKDIAE